MKKFTFLLLSLILLSSCKKDPGTIKGNLYWKYNEYVGNKPDAGATVNLFSFEGNEKGRSIAETTTDVAGNFTFENLEPGKYFYVSKSKNVRSCPDYIFIYLKLYKSDLKRLFGFDISKFDTQITEIENLHDKYAAILQDHSSKYASLSEKIGKYQAVKAEVDTKSEELFKKFPDDLKAKLNYYGPSDYKIDMQVVKVKEKETSQVNHDFDITCF